MLVFMRKVGESFYIGEDIEITIMDMESKQVKVSVNAPRSLPIVRKELLEKEAKNQTREDVAEVMKKIKSKAKKDCS